MPYRDVITNIKQNMIDNEFYFDEAIGSRIYEMAKDYIVEIEYDVKNNYMLR